MSSLVLAILSIALAAIIAISTIYYGGDSWVRASPAIKAEGYASMIKQVKTAASAEFAHVGPGLYSAEDLVEKRWLSAVPKVGTSWTITPSGTVMVSTLNQDTDEIVTICEAMNKNIGLDVVPTNIYEDDELVQSAGVLSNRNKALLCSATIFRTTGDPEATEYSAVFVHY